MVESDPDQIGNHEILNIGGTDTQVDLSGVNNTLVTEVLTSGTAITGGGGDAVIYAQDVTDITVTDTDLTHGNLTQTSIVGDVTGVDITTDGADNIVAIGAGTTDGLTLEAEGDTTLAVTTGADLTGAQINFDGVDSNTIVQADATVTSTDIIGGDDDDNLVLESGAVVQDSLFVGGDESDSLTLQNGAVFADSRFSGDDDEDSVAAEQGSLLDHTTLDLGDGDDVLTLAGQSIGSRVELGDGSDYLQIQQTFEGDFDLSDSAASWMWAGETEIHEQDVVELQGEGWDLVETPDGPKLIARDEGGAILSQINLSGESDYIESIYTVDAAGNVNSLQNIQSEIRTKLAALGPLSSLLMVAGFTFPPAFAVGAALKFTYDAANNQVSLRNGLSVAVQAIALGAPVGSLQSLAPGLWDTITSAIDGDVLGGVTSGVLTFAGLGEAIGAVKGVAPIVSEFVDGLDAVILTVDSVKAGSPLAVINGLALLGASVGPDGTPQLVFGAVQGVSSSLDAAINEGDFLEGLAGALSTVIETGAFDDLPIELRNAGRALPFIEDVVEQLTSGEPLDGDRLGGNFLGLYGLVDEVLKAPAGDPLEDVTPFPGDDQQITDPPLTPFPGDNTQELAYDYNAVGELAPSGLISTDDPEDPTTDPQSEAGDDITTGEIGVSGDDETFNFDVPPDTASSDDPETLEFGPLQQFETDDGLFDFLEDGAIGTQATDPILDANAEVSNPKVFDFATGAGTPTFTPLDPDSLSIDQINDDLLNGDVELFQPPSGGLSFGELSDDLATFDPAAELSIDDSLGTLTEVSLENINYSTLPAAVELAPDAVVRDIAVGGYAVRVVVEGENTFVAYRIGGVDRKVRIPSGTDAEVDGYVSELLDAGFLPGLKGEYSITLSDVGEFDVPSVEGELPTFGFTDDTDLEIFGGDVVLDPILPAPDQRNEITGADPQTVAEVDYSFALARNGNSDAKEGLVERLNGLTTEAEIDAYVLAVLASNSGAGAANLYQYAQDWAADNETISEHFTGEGDPNAPDKKLVASLGRLYASGEIDASNFALEHQGISNEEILGTLQGAYGGFTSIDPLAVKDSLSAGWNKFQAGGYGQGADIEELILYIGNPELTESFYEQRSLDDLSSAPAEYQNMIETGAEATNMTVADFNLLEEHVKLGASTIDQSLAQEIADNPNSASRAAQLNQVAKESFLAGFMDAAREIGEDIPGFLWDMLKEESLETIIPILEGLEIAQIAGGSIFHLGRASVGELQVINGTPENVLELVNGVSGDYRQAGSLLGNYFLSGGAMRVGSTTLSAGGAVIGNLATNATSNQTTSSTDSPSVIIPQTSAANLAENVAENDILQHLGNIAPEGSIVGTRELGGQTFEISQDDSGAFFANRNGVEIPLGTGDLASANQNLDNLYLSGGIQGTQAPAEQPNPTTKLELGNFDTAITRSVEGGTNVYDISYTIEGDTYTGRLEGATLQEAQQNAQELFQNGQLTGLSTPVDPNAIIPELGDIEVTGTTSIATEVDLNTTPDIASLSAIPNVVANNPFDITSTSSHHITSITDPDVLAETNATFDDFDFDGSETTMENFDPEDFDIELPAPEDAGFNPADMPTFSNARDYFAPTTIAEAQVEFMQRNGYTTPFDVKGHDGFSHLLQTADELSLETQFTDFVDQVIADTMFLDEATFREDLIKSAQSEADALNMSASTADYLIEQLEHNADLNGLSLQEFTDKLRTGEDFDTLLVQRPRAVPLDSAPVPDPSTPNSATNPTSSPNDITSQSADPDIVNNSPYDITSITDPDVVAQSNNSDQTDSTDTPNPFGIDSTAPYTVDPTGPIIPELTASEITAETPNNITPENTDLEPTGNIPENTDPDVETTGDGNDNGDGNNNPPTSTGGTPENVEAKLQGGGIELAQQILDQRFGGGSNLGSGPLTVSINTPGGPDSAGSGDFQSDFGTSGGRQIIAPSADYLNSPMVDQLYPVAADPATGTVWIDLQQVDGFDLSEHDLDALTADQRSVLETIATLEAGDQLLSLPLQDFDTAADARRALADTIADISENSGNPLGSELELTALIYEQGGRHYIGRSVSIGGPQGAAISLLDSGLSGASRIEVVHTHPGYANIVGGGAQAYLNPVQQSTLSPEDTATVDGLVTRFTQNPDLAPGLGEVAVTSINTLTRDITTLTRTDTSPLSVETTDLRFAPGDRGAVIPPWIVIDGVQFRTINHIDLQVAAELGIDPSAPLSEREAVFYNAVYGLNPEGADLLRQNQFIRIVDPVTGEPNPTPRIDLTPEQFEAVLRGETIRIDDQTSFSAANDIIRAQADLHQFNPEPGVVVDPNRPLPQNPFDATLGVNLTRYETGRLLDQLPQNPFELSEDPFDWIIHYATRGIEATRNASVRWFDRAGSQLARSDLAQRQIRRMFGDLVQDNQRARGESALQITTEEDGITTIDIEARPFNLLDKIADARRQVFVLGTAGTALPTPANIDLNANVGIVFSAATLVKLRDNFPDLIRAVQSGDMASVRRILGEAVGLAGDTLQGVLDPSPASQIPGLNQYARNGYFNFLVKTLNESGAFLPLPNGGWQLHGRPITEAELADMPPNMIGEPAKVGDYVLAADLPIDDAALQTKLRSIFLQTGFPREELEKRGLTLTIPAGTPIPANIYNSINDRISRPANIQTISGPGAAYEDSQFIQIRARDIDVVARSEGEQFNTSFIKKMILALNNKTDEAALFTGEIEESSYHLGIWTTPFSFSIPYVANLGGSVMLFRGPKETVGETLDPVNLGLELSSPGTAQALSIANPRRVAGLLITGSGGDVSAALDIVSITDNIGVIGPIDGGPSASGVSLLTVRLDSGEQQIIAVPDSLLTVLDGGPMTVTARNELAAFLYLYSASDDVEVQDAMREALLNLSREELDESLSATSTISLNDLLRVITQKGIVAELPATEETVGTSTDADHNGDDNDLGDDLDDPDIDPDEDDNEI